jgi:hypothetical protein
MTKRLVLHLGFAVLAAALVTRVVVAVVAADDRHAQASAEIAEWIEKWPDFLQSQIDEQGRDEANQISADPASLLTSLNCSSREVFDYARPARNGFVCASQGRPAHPITVFIYDAGAAETVRQERTNRACEKARQAGRPATYVLTTDELFVWTTSSSAVEASDVSEQFIKLDSRICS